MVLEPVGALRASEEARVSCATLAIMVPTAQVKWELVPANFDPMVERRETIGPENVCHCLEMSTPKKNAVTYKHAVYQILLLSINLLLSLCQNAQ